MTSDETKHIVPIARALIGNRSAVVIKTPKGDVKERRIPAGELEVIGQTKKLRVNVDSGAQEIMKCINNVSPINDIKGESGTNAGGMLERVRQVMSNLTRFISCRYICTTTYKRWSCKRVCARKCCWNCSNGQSRQTSNADDCR